MMQTLTKSVYLPANVFNVINQEYHDDPEQHQTQVTTCWEVRDLQEQNQYFPNMNTYLNANEMLKLLINWKLKNKLKRPQKDWPA